MEEVKTLSVKKQRKNVYWGKLEAAFAEYKNILIITVDFVGSKQMQTVRQSIRGEGVVLMGKNTVIRKVIRENLEKYPNLAGLLPHIVGNMGFIFTNGDLNAIRKKVIEFKLPASAKAGVVAPMNVEVPAGPTGLDPGQTSFFQTLNIATKISKGTIEITTSTKVCTAGEKISTSAVALLSKLGIKPFEFGIEIPLVYESGSVYEASVLDLEQSDLVRLFCNAASKLAAISFAIGSVNSTTVPHSVGRAFNLLLALAVAAGYEFEGMADIMSAGPGGGGGGDAGAAAGGDAPAAAAEEDDDEEEAAAPDMFGGDAAEEGDY
jgi:large subunit ribosomal protein LP0